MSPGSGPGLHRPWRDEAFASCTGVGEQKQVDLVRDDRVGVTTGTNTWAAATDDGSTDGAGSDPWVYVVRPATVIAFGKDPHSQTTSDLAPAGWGGRTLPRPRP